MYMYVSYINDIGHRNNYFYMRGLQGTCVGNTSYSKQILSVVQYPVHCYKLHYMHTNMH